MDECKLARYYKQQGFILGECLISIIIVLIIITLAMGTVHGNKVLNRDLDETTELMVMDLRRVQLITMLGYRSEGDSHTTFVLHKEYSFWMERAQLVPGSMRTFPKNIKNKYIVNKVMFGPNGLPSEEMCLILVDTQSNKENRIWISVQTGRIRWEHGPSV